MQIIPFKQWKHAKFGEWLVLGTDARSKARKGKAEIDPNLQGPRVRLRKHLCLSFRVAIQLLLSYFSVHVPYKLTFLWIKMPTPTEKYLKNP